MLIVVGFGLGKRAGPAIACPYPARGQAQNAARFGINNPAAVLRHRWAEIVEGADIISQLVRDYRELSSDIDAAEELFEVYPGG